MTVVFHRTRGWSLDMDEQEELQRVAKKYVMNLIEKSKEMYFKSLRDPFSGDDSLFAQQFLLVDLPDAPISNHNPHYLSASQEMKYKSGRPSAVSPWPSRENAKAIKKFLYYERGVPIFLDEEGHKVFSNNTKYKRDCHVPGSPEEMKLLYFVCSKLLQEETDIPTWDDKGQDIKSKNCSRIVKDVKDGLGALPDTRGFDRQIPGSLNIAQVKPIQYRKGGFDSRIPSSLKITQIKPKSKGRRFSIGVFNLEHEKHRQTLREFQLYMSIKHKREQTPEGNHPLKCRKLFTPNEPNRPPVSQHLPVRLTIDMPRFVFSKDGCKPYPVPSQAKRSSDDSRSSCGSAKNGTKAVVRHWRNKFSTDRRSSVITKSQNYTYHSSMKSKPLGIGTSMKMFSADRLFNPGVKIQRPVRGNRIWPLKPPLRKVLDSRANRDSFEITGQNVDQVMTRSTTLAFHEPLQLLDSEGRDEPNQVYLTNKFSGNKMSLDPRHKKEPVSLRTVSLPRKGRIKLTALSYELDNPEYFDDRKEVPPPPRHHKLRRPKFQIVLPVLCMSLC